MADFNPIRIGTRWALVWDNEAMDFYVERPGNIDGNSDTPPEGRYLAALQKLSNQDEFVEKIMDFIDGEITEWRKTRSA